MGKAILCRSFLLQKTSYDLTRQDPSLPHGSNRHKNFPSAAQPFMSPRGNGSSTIRNIIPFIAIVHNLYACGTGPAEARNTYIFHLIKASSEARRAFRISIFRRMVN